MDCGFEYKNPEGGIHSIMAHHPVRPLYKAFEFCDIGNHNANAKTKQNDICGTSVWETIRTMEDFQNAHDFLDQSEAPETEFVLMQTESIHLVLVLDVSGSMSGQWKTDQKIDAMIRHAKTIIKEQLQNNTYLGIVSFR